METKRNQIGNWVLVILIILALLSSALQAGGRAPTKQRVRAYKQQKARQAQNRSSSQAKRASRQPSSRSKQAMTGSSSSRRSSTRPQQSRPKQTARRASSRQAQRPSQPAARRRSGSNRTVSSNSYNSRSAAAKTPRTTSRRPAASGRKVRSSQPVNRTVSVISTAKTNQAGIKTTRPPAAKQPSQNRSVRTASTARSRNNSRSAPVVITPGKPAQTSQPKVAKSATKATIAPKISTSAIQPRRSRPTQVVTKVQPKSTRTTAKTTSTRTTASRTATKTGQKNNHRKAANINNKTTSIIKQPTQQKKQRTLTALQRQTVKPIRVKVDDIDVKTNRVTVNKNVTKSTAVLKQRRETIKPKGGRRATTSVGVNKTLVVNNKTVVRGKGGRRSGSIKAAAATTLSTASSGHTNKHRRPKIVINGSNNKVIVQGKVNQGHHRPHISRGFCNNVSYLRTSSRWRPHRSGSYFSFRWSSSSCGVVVALGYSSPSCGCIGTCYHRHTPVRYRRYGYSYCYPRYHRKYLFVSPCGYWPNYYRYRRYYWYGCHPYYWYGARVITAPTRNVTYNTYNYYGDNYDSDSTRAYYSVSPGTDAVVDDYDEIRDQLVDEPHFETPADLCFAHGVKIFSDGHYDEAAEQFREAVILAPDDVVLPFTYCQALFADGQYAHAASVLRRAIAQIPEDEMTIYYPRGLYENEVLLEKQIAQLEAAVQKEPFAAEYQLLLGYQYLGLGQLDKATGPLSEAAKDLSNAHTAIYLLDLKTKMENEIATLEQNR